MNIPGRRAPGVSTPGSERALANRYMLEHWQSAMEYWRVIWHPKTDLKAFLNWFAWFAKKLLTRVLNDSGVLVPRMTGSGTWRSTLSKVKGQTPSTRGVLCEPTDPVNPNLATRGPRPDCYPQTR